MNHRITFAPNNAQATYFAQACGVARFAYNWALVKWQRQYIEGGEPREAELRKQLNAIREEQFPWVEDFTKSAPQQAIKNLGSAFDRFFKKQGGSPEFKKKGVHDGEREVVSRRSQHGILRI
ncbi:transposase [Azospirillaceae bacterium]